MAGSSMSLEPVEEGIRRRAGLLEQGDLEKIGAVMKVPEDLVERVFGGNDLQALTASSLGLLSWDGVNARSLNFPSFHYAGEKEQLLAATRQAAETMPGAVFMMIPGLDH